MASLHNSYYCIVPAAGQGSRIELSTFKQYLPLYGKTIIEHALAPLCVNPAIIKIILVLHPNDTKWQTTCLAKSMKIITTIGGKERINSVLNGLKVLISYAKADDFVLVHDAARPCLTPQDLTKLITSLHDHPIGGLLATPVKDTLKKTDDQLKVIKTLPRENIWQALTPQMFRFSLLYKALERAIINNENCTDEAMAIEMAGFIPQIVKGRADNIKVTYKEDLKLAENILMNLVQGQP